MSKKKTLIKCFFGFLSCFVLSLTVCAESCSSSGQKQFRYKAQGCDTIISTRTCCETGLWSDWDKECEYECRPGEVEEKKCQYGYSYQKRTCLSSYTWSGWQGVCLGHYDAEVVRAANQYYFSGKCSSLFSFPIECVDYIENFAASLADAASVCDADVEAEHFCGWNPPGSKCVAQDTMIVGTYEWELVQSGSDCYCGGYTTVYTCKE